jgi:fatty-acyl-CoA synthase
MTVPKLQLRPGCGRHPERQLLEDGRSAPALPAADTLIHALDWWATHDPDRTACHLIEFSGHTSSFSASQLMTAARRTAAALRQRGVIAGDRVVLCMETIEGVLTSFLACMVLGAIPSISDTPFGNQDTGTWQSKLSARLRLVNARWAIAEERTEVLVSGSGHNATVLLRADLVGQDEPIELSAAPDQPGFIQFTSGTVTSGRAICLSHRAVMENLRAIVDRGDFLSSDLLVSWLPLYHDLGLVANLLVSLALGIPIVQMSPLTFLMRPARWLWAIHYFRGTTVCSPNFAYEMCVRRVKDEEIAGLDVSSLRNVYNCAEFVHADTLRRFNQRFAAHGFDDDAWRPSYGMAEIVVGATVRVHTQPIRIDQISRRELGLSGRAIPVDAEHPDAMEVVSCGPVFRGYELRIVDDDGNDLPERVEGEIVLKGPSLFDGYVGDDHATAEVLQQGWLFTGDLGYRVGDELYICGRKKDLIVRAGENQHPYLLERAVAQVKGVRPSVAALGIEDAVLGTQALVVVFETRITEAEQLHALCREVRTTLGRSFGLRPDRIVPVAPGAIPKTTSGKIRRRALPALLDGIDKLRQAAAPV